jgi:anti-sigma regulatory factor (Ser/Thr protein kinase)
MFTLALETFEQLQLPKQKHLRILPSKKNVVQASIPSQTKAIDQTVWYFQRQIATFCRTSRLPSVNISLCLREALANAIIHGNLEIPPTLKDTSWEKFDALIQEREAIPDFASRQVIIRCQMSSARLTMEVEDEGPGFDTSQTRLPLRGNVVEFPGSEPTTISAGGRGLIIIHSFMDQVYWNDQGNCITMIKIFS